MRVDLAARARKIPCQRLGSIALLLQGQSQLRCSAFRGLLDLRRFGARVACRRHVRIDFAARHRQLARQFACQRGGAVGRLLELRLLVGRLARLRRMHLGFSARDRQFARLFSQLKVKLSDDALCFGELVCKSLRTLFLFQ